MSNPHHTGRRYAVPTWLLAVIALLGLLALLLVPLPSAHATDLPPEECVPSEGVAAYDEVVVDAEAYDETVIDSPAGWQRYSWTGGPVEGDVAPAFPGDAWQANVAGDPHGIGVEGAYFKTHGNSGNGDWFYLEATPEVSHVVHHEAVTHIVQHEAIPPVVCEEEPTDPVLQVGGYCYDKLNPALPAAWENSGLQTLAASKPGFDDWTLAEKFALCELPLEACEPISIGFQSDWTSTEEGFTFPEHIQYPVDNIGWPPIYQAAHTDLTQALAADCGPEEPPVVLPEVCVSPGIWGTEGDDTAPVLTNDGLVFTGGSGKAVGYGSALAGNLQGLGEITVAVTGDVDVFYPRIVINSLADGGFAYDSLTVISEGPVNGSSIAASNKRGFVQHTLDEWAALLPNNQLVAFFLHLDSGATADQSVIVTSVGGACLAADFTVEEPPVEEPPVVDPPGTLPTKLAEAGANGEAGVNLAGLLLLAGALALGAPRLIARARHRD